MRTSYFYFALTVVFVCSSVFPVFVQAETVSSSRSAQIQSLIQLLQQLEAQLAQLRNGTSGSSRGTCRITTDKSSYSLHDTMLISWEAPSGSRVAFYNQAPLKDNLQLPFEKTYSATGNIRVEASVIGNPTLAMRVTHSTGKQSTCTKTVPVHDESLTLMYNGANTDSIVVSADNDQQRSVEVSYIPTGNVKLCKIVGYYDRGSDSVTHPWKGTVEPGQYGRVVFSIVGAYPKRDIKKIVAICTLKDRRTTSDTIYVDVVSSSGIGDFYSEFNGRETASASSIDYIEAYSRCMAEVDDIQDSEMPEQGKAVECFWKGDSFYYQDGWKG